MHAVRGAAFAVPGALGAQEGGLIVLCAIFGVPPEAALALSLVKRIPDLVLGVPGLLAWQAIEGLALFRSAAARRADDGSGRGCDVHRRQCCCALLAAALLGCVAWSRRRRWRRRFATSRCDRAAVGGARGDHPQAAARRRDRACSGISCRSASRTMPARCRSCSASPTRTILPSPWSSGCARRIPDKTIELVVDARIAGPNPKVANLVNMSAHIAHESIVLADSDIQVPPDYLSRVVAALERADGGAVTCAYYGSRPAICGPSSPRSTSTAIFFPACWSARASSCRGRASARPSRCAGTRLSAVGGFEAIADCLADDYAIGAAIARAWRAGDGAAIRGRPCAATNARSAELWRHELRWATTIRSIDPFGYLGWIATHALPLALMALALGGGLPRCSWSCPHSPAAGADLCHRAGLRSAAASLLAHPAA